MSDRISLPKDRIRVLLLEGISDQAVALLNAAGYHTITRVPKALDGKDLAAALQGVHMLGIRSRTQLMARCWRPPTGCSPSGCFCIGTNQVDLDVARRPRHPGLQRALLQHPFASPSW